MSLESTQKQCQLCGEAFSKEPKLTYARFARRRKCGPCRKINLKRRLEADRFWEKVGFAQPGGCWIWRRCRDKNGYGRFGANEGTMLAHQWAYVRARGPVPAGLELDHTCRNPSCVNPAHLQPVTHLENMRRSPFNHRPRAAWISHCKRGHPLEGLNLYVGPNGRRVCRECKRNNLRAWRLGSAEGGA